METRRCVWCGTENEPTRPTCSSCGARLVPLESSPAVWATSPQPAAMATPAGPAIPPPPPQPLRATAWGPMPPWPTPSVPTARRSLHPVVWVAIGLLVLLGGLGWRLVHRPLIGFPDSVAGHAKLTGGMYDAAVKAIEGTTVAGHKMRAAFYGSSEPQFLVVVSDYSSLSDPDAEARAFAGGFEGTSNGGHVNLDAEIRDVRDGVSFICAPITGTSNRTSVCLWTDAHTTGYVMDYTTDDLGACLTFTQEAQAAVVND